MKFLFQVKGMDLIRRRENNKLAATKSRERKKLKRLAMEVRDFRLIVKIRCVCAGRADFAST
jgi:hypothetical protein